jgi:hypothetical protein
MVKKGTGAKVMVASLVSGDDYRACHSHPLRGMRILTMNQHWMNRFVGAS